MYNQIGDAKLKNSCSILALLDALAIDWNFIVKRDSTIILLEYLEKISAWFPKWGASAGVVYPAFEKYVKFKYGLSIKIRTSDIDHLTEDRSYILGFKKASRFFLQLGKDKVISREDIEEISKYTGTVSGHFFCWKKGITQDNLGDYRARWSKENLSYAYAKGLFYYNCRYVEPGDEKTKIIAEKIKTIGENRKKLGWKIPFVSLDEAKVLKII